MTFSRSVVINSCECVYHKNNNKYKKHYLMSLHVAFSLLRLCGSYCKLVHLARAVPPTSVQML